MDINTQLEGKTLTISLGGRLDTTTAPDLEMAIQPIRNGEVEEFIIDMNNLEYVSSAGLRVLLSAQKNMNRYGSMVIRNVCPEVMEVFEITGFLDIFTIE